MFLDLGNGQIVLFEQRKNMATVRIGESFEGRIQIRYLDRYLNLNAVKNKLQGIF